MTETLKYRTRNKINQFEKFQRQIEDDFNDVNSFSGSSKSSSNSNSSTTTTTTASFSTLNKAQTSFILKKSPLVHLIANSGELAQETLSAVASGDQVTEATTATNCGELEKDRGVERMPQKTKNDIDDDAISTSFSSNKSADTFNRSYKFSLNNHFLTMPHVDETKHQNHNNAKLINYYSNNNRKKKFNENQSDIVGPVDNETNQTKISAKTKASVDRYLESIRNNLTIRENTGKSNEINNDGEEEQEEEKEDRCDLSVMVSSSAGALSSLSTISSSSSSSSSDEDDKNDGVKQKVAAGKSLQKRTHNSHQQSVKMSASASACASASTDTIGNLNSSTQQQRTIGGRFEQQVPNTATAAAAHREARQPSFQQMTNSSLLSYNNNNSSNNRLKNTTNECYFAQQQLPTTATTVYSNDDEGGGGGEGVRELVNNASKSETLDEFKLRKQCELTASGNDDCASNSVLIKFSSIMYATFLVVLGCILHVSELRQQSKNSSDHIYTTIVALIGIFWLLFLQIDLQRYKKYASKYILIESIFNDQIKLQKSKQQQQQLQLQLQLGNNFNEQNINDNNGQLMMMIKDQSKDLFVDPTARSTSSSSASLVNDRMSVNTELIFKKTAYKMFEQQQQQQHHRLKQNQENKKFTNDLNCNIATSELSPRQRNRFNCHSNNINNNINPAYKFLHGKMGANFYLKCGMAAFCFGSVIHEGLRFGQQVYFFATSNVDCRDSAALIAHLVTPLYSFYQLFMMFKYSNLVINRHKILARFGLMHIIGTCVTFWFRTILEEAFEDFVHKMDYFKAQNKPLNIDASMMFSHNPTPAAPSSPGINSLISSESNVEDKRGETLMALNATTQSGGGRSANNYNNNNNNQRDIMTTTTISSNSSLVNSALIALMSSPISATITPQLVKHLPDSYACAQNTLLTTKSMNALPYLYPFTIEYNLLIAATFLSLYFNIGKIGNNKNNCSKQRESSNNNNDIRSEMGGIGSSTGSSGNDNHNHSSSSSFNNYNKNNYHHHHHHLMRQSPIIRLQPASCWPSGTSFSSVLANSLLVDQQSAITTSEHSSSSAAIFKNNSSNQFLFDPSIMNHNLRDETSTASVAAAEAAEAAQRLAGEYKSNFVVNADCHSANKGLFCGFFVLLVTLVTIVIFFVTINKPSHVQLGIKINLIQEATLSSLILIVTLAAFRQIVRLNRNTNLKDKVSTDDVLMLIPLPFFFIHSLLSFRAETASLYSSTTTTTNSLASQSANAAAAVAAAAAVNQRQRQQQQQQTNLSSILLDRANNNDILLSMTTSNSNNLIKGQFDDDDDDEVVSASNTSTLLSVNNGQLNNGLNGFNLQGSRTNPMVNSRQQQQQQFKRANLSNATTSTTTAANTGQQKRNNIQQPPLKSNVKIVQTSTEPLAKSNSNLSSSSKVDYFKLLTVALNLGVMIEVLVQTNFIIDALRRCSESRYLRFKKPGRELITFAILLNITYWIVATFETKSVEQYKTEIEYYGPLPYMFISHTTLPVMLFYRYHSSVCLAEIWNRAYKLPKK